jgi:HK97 family phage portal protein
MILKTRYTNNLEVRMPEFGTQHLIPPPWYGSQTASGQIVTSDTATGLPAIGRAIRLVGGLVGAATLTVFQGRGGDRRELETHPLVSLFANPYAGTSDYDWRYDIAVSLEVTENAFIRKIKTNRGKVVALQVLPPKWVNARVDRDGDKVFELQTPQGRQMIPDGEMLHIRGQTVDGGPFGVSRLLQHRDPVGAQLAAQQFEGAYFRNHARPDVAFVFPANVNVEQGRQFEAEIRAKYGGPENAGKPYVIGGGAQIETIALNLRDAQFIEAKNFSVEDIGRIMDVEPILIGGAQFESNDVQAVDRFLAFQIPPRLARIASGLHADPDLFPQKPDPYPDFKADPLMFASPLTRAAVQHRQIQAGTLLPDEARADNGRPPLPDGLGEIPQITPVGGAPNPDPLPTTDEPADADGARALALNGHPT